MIFLTVGTIEYQFNRLIKKVDELVEKGKIREKVIAQIGYSTYKPKNFKYFSFASEEEILRLNKKARIIISHGGVGSIILGLQFKKPIIVVPRLKKFNEHIDDHQIQIAKEFGKYKKVLTCFDVEKLEQIIKKAKNFKPSVSSKSQRIFKIIKSYLENNENKN
ncbi:MAG: PssE/Cps14G family polysaccharide biosynthesis glycosyltransferase [Candidatus Aenigmatarchaeota archaeon]